MQNKASKESQEYWGWEGRGLVLVLIHLYTLFSLSPSGDKAYANKMIHGI